MTEQLPTSIKILSALIPFGLMSLIGLVIYSTAYELDQRVIPIFLIVLTTITIVVCIEFLTKKPIRERESKNE